VDAAFAELKGVLTNKTELDLARLAAQIGANGAAATNAADLGGRVMESLQPSAGGLGFQALDMAKLAARIAGRASRGTRTLRALQKDALKLDAATMEQLTEQVMSKTSTADMTEVIATTLKEKEPEMTPKQQAKVAAAAAAIASGQTPDRPPDELRKGPNGFINSGVTVLNPYRITANSNNQQVLQTSDTATKAMIEFIYSDRWAWREPMAKEKDASSFVLGNWDPHHWDFMGRGSYTFTGSSTNAATIPGSGELSLEFSFAKQILRWSHETDAHSVNLEIFGGGVSDRGFNRIHPRFVPGLGYTTSFALLSSNRVDYLFRGGLGLFDAPSYSTVNGVAQTDNSGNYRIDPTSSYSLLWRPVLETEVYYPIGTAGALNAGGRLYMTPDHQRHPDQWSFWVGYSLNIETLANALKGIIPFGNSSSSSTAAK
jgi:hypothetical protein